MSDRIAVWKIKRGLEEWGEDGLKDHRPGRLFEPLNHKFYDIRLKNGKETNAEQEKLYQVLKRKGI